MSSYSIKQLELVSGIKAHTIRMWERRYNIFSPQRTDTNIRRYTDTDVRFILNVTLLLRNGYKISKLALMTLDEISDLTLKISSNITHSKETDFEPLIISLLSFDQSTFRSYLNKKINEKGLENTYETFILPILYRLGLLWQTGMIKTTHEHFATNIIKHAIIYNYESLREPVNDSPIFLFFLPENEYHEIGLLFFAYLAKKAGFRVIYLGQSTPIEEVTSTSTEIKPAILFTSISSSVSKINLTDFAKNIRRKIPKCHLLVTGHKVNQDRFKMPKEVSAISSIESFNKILKAVSRQKNN